MAEGITQDRIRIAAAQYPIELLPSFETWEAKLARWVEEAVVRGADCLVFPEYAAMELAGTDPAAAGDLAASLELVIALGEAYDAACRALAVKHGIVLLGGSRPFRRDDGIVVNRARLHTPDGGGGYQDKIVMTRFERELWGVSGGDTIQVIDTPAGLVGIAICFDVEFPLIARAQAEAGARLILAPSATDTMQGFWRVRIGAQARALENQCFVVQASTVGLADWLPALDENQGAAGVFCPPDGNTPHDGVVASGEPSQPGWTYADIDLGEVAAWRSRGSVLNFAQWPEQAVAVPPRHAAAPVGQVFVALARSDARLADEVAARIGITLPEPCVPGVAANARLLQVHTDTLRGPVR